MDVDAAQILERQCDLIDRLARTMGKLEIRLDKLQRQLADQSVNGSRVAFTREEAAAALGCSVAHFRRHVQPHLKIVRTGSCRLVPITELERWVRENATLAGGE